MNILVADMGGTNCRFALLNASKQIDNSGAIPDLGSRCHLPTSEYKDVYALLKALASRENEQGEGFLPVSKKPSRVDLAVFAVAGPVQGSKAYAPNMGSAGNKGWHIDAVECAKVCGIAHVVLINDFVAQAFACLVPDVSRPEQILGPASSLMATDTAARLINGAEERVMEPMEPVAIVGAGTGLGMCLLLPQKSANPYDRQYLASEGGHASFSFETPDEWDFAAFMQRKTGKQRLIGDDIVSGSGLACLHSYFYNEELSPAEVATRLHPESKVLEYFARFYGRACRDYVLTTLAWGGVCIAGGVAARNPVLVKHPAFAANFYNCGAHRALLDKVPVWLYLEADAGLWGAAAYAAGVTAAV